MRFLELPQNQPEWAAWRKSGIGASEAATILGLSPFPEQTRLALWKRKTGRSPEIETNFAMRRGLLLEPKVRRSVEAKYGMEFPAVCVQHEALAWMCASLDGLDKWGDIILEIKCPDLPTHQKALRKIVPEHYSAQILHQLEVTGAAIAIYASYSEHQSVPLSESLAIVEVFPDPDYQRRIVEAETRFWDCIVNDCEPGKEVAA